MEEEVSQNCPTFPFYKLTEKWFYILYIEKVFQKTNTFLQNYGKCKTQCFIFIGFYIIPCAEYSNTVKVIL